ncbi:phage tail protein [Xenorhabdus szentirmaii]|uniref:Phage minor tail protein M n=1 Tax=Xenorhabdus szentirmaii DSM 16338 TaxID=1427518 RepID=W1IR75_9GAMM|nr:phage tail protein [Xenorhabdus szentirmaii]PHM30515.1 tail protein [Xenorhabdus szentirmaii DSM 16338]CDL80972.1 putative phage minor tail protein M [Xenorhabdus szentirmaii DSM 16338]
MERKTFKWHPKFESRKNFKPAISRQSFDEGYEQRLTSGFNWRKYEWSLVFEGGYPLIQEIEDFLYEHGGKDSFNWISPDKKLYLIVCEGFNVTRGQGSATLTATFRQVFE